MQESPWERLARHPNTDMVDMDVMSVIDSFVRNQVEHFLMTEYNNPEGDNWKDNPTHPWPLSSEPATQPEPPEWMLSATPKPDSVRCPCRKTSIGPLFMPFDYENDARRDWIPQLADVWRTWIESIILVRRATELDSLDAAVRIDYLHNLLEDVRVGASLMEREYESNMPKKGDPHGPHFWAGGDISTNPTSIYVNALLLRILHEIQKALAFLDASPALQSLKVVIQHKARLRTGFWILFLRQRALLNISVECGAKLARPCFTHYIMWRNIFSLLKSPVYDSKTYLESYVKGDFFHGLKDGNRFLQLFLEGLPFAHDSIRRRRARLLPSPGSVSFVGDKPKVQFRPAASSQAVPGIHNCNLLEFPPVPHPNGEFPVRQLGIRGTEYRPLSKSTHDRFAWTERAVSQILYKRFWLMYRQAVVGAPTMSGKADEVVDKKRDTVMTAFSQQRVSQALLQYPEWLVGARTRAPTTRKAVLLQEYMMDVCETYYGDPALLNIDKFSYSTGEIAEWFV